MLVITTDHATYGDEDFVKAFPDYKRINTEMDEIPLYIYHKGITHCMVDANGRNSLDMAPTILDYMDVSEENYFLGNSLFSQEKQNEFNFDTLFYDSYYYLSSSNAEITTLDKEKYLKFNDIPVC